MIENRLNILLLHKLIYFPPFPGLFPPVLHAVLVERVHILLYLVLYLPLLLRDRLLFRSEILPLFDYRLKALLQLLLLLLHKHLPLALDLLRVYLGSLIPLLLLLLGLLLQALVAPEALKLLHTLLDLLLGLARGLRFVLLLELLTDLLFFLFTLLDLLDLN